MADLLPEHRAKDALDEITDIIVNRYEEGYRYSARELSEILDAIVEIMDAYTAATEGNRAGEVPSA